MKDDVERTNKPYAVSFIDRAGYFTFHCKTREQAKVAIEEAMKGEEDEVEVKLEDIKDEVVYYHRRCGYYSLGENTCGECGEQIRGNGRHTFAYYFPL